MNTPGFHAAQHEKFIPDILHVIVLRREEVMHCLQAVESCVIRRRKWSTKIAAKTIFDAETHMPPRGM